MDRRLFWRLLKTARKGVGGKTLAIRNSKGKVVHDIKHVLNAWNEHFEEMCKSIVDSDFNNEHFVKVKVDVDVYNKHNSIGPFLNEPILLHETRKAIGGLHFRNACVFNGI